MRFGLLQAGLIGALLGGTELPAQHAAGGPAAGAGRVGTPSHVTPPVSRGVAPPAHLTAPHHAPATGLTGHWPSWGYNNHMQKPQERHPYVYPGFLSFGYGLPLGYGYAGGFDPTGDSEAPQSGPVAPYPAAPADAEEAVNAPPFYRPPYQSLGETAVVPPARPQPATTLIFKDGRAPQQVHNYALIGSALWALDGDTRQEIPLQTLDIPATVKANRDAGVDFALPSSR